MENLKLDENLKVLKEVLKRLGNPGLIVRDGSFGEFAKIWIVHNPVISDYANKTGYELPINFNNRDIYIRKGLGVDKIVFVAKEKLTPSGVPVFVSRLYLREYYDGVCDVLKCIKVPIAIDLEINNHENLSDQSI